MLSVEEIKKCCEFADGFNIDATMDQGTWIVCPDTKDYLLRILPPYSEPERTMWINIYYPLFLQRVIEGITEKYGFQFDAYFNKDSKQWNYMFFNKMDIQYPESKGLLPHTNNVIDGDIIDQAKEQAIIYILESL